MPPLALTPSRSADCAGHQLDSAHRCAAAGMKSGGGLHEIGAGVLGDPAHLDQSLLAADGNPTAPPTRRSPSRSTSVRYRVANRRDVGPHRVEVAVKGRSDVDHHVDLVGARGDGKPCLLGLDRRKMFAGRESHDRGECGIRRSAATWPSSTIDGDTHTAIHAESGRLVRQRGHVGLGRLGFEQRVVDERGHPSRDVTTRGVIRTVPRGRRDCSPPRSSPQRRRRVATARGSSSPCRGRRVRRSANGTGTGPRMPGQVGVGRERQHLGPRFVGLTRRCAAASTPGAASGTRAGWTCSPQCTHWVWSMYGGPGIGVRRRHRRRRGTPQQPRPRGGGGDERTCIARFYRDLPWISRILGRTSTR